MARPISATCRVCGQPKPPGYCQPCRVATYTRNNAKTAAKLPPRKCRDCSTTIARPKRLCDNCREAANAKHLKDTAARYLEWVKNNRQRHYARVAARKRRQRGAIGSHTYDEWLAVLKRFGNKCAECGTKERLTKDHITPLARGGTDYAFNLQPLCKSCNCRKHTKLVGPPSLFDRVAV